MASGPHRCTSHDGAAVSRCDGSGALSAPALASFTVPAHAAVSLAPAALEFVPLALVPPAAVTAAPETPPPKV